MCQFAIPLGFVAVIAGWLVTEVGRQPWTVYGLLRTAQSVSPSLTGRDVLISLLAYMVVYLFMYPAGVLLMWRIVRRGPAAAPPRRSRPSKVGGPSAGIGRGERRRWRRAMSQVLDFVPIWTLILGMAVFFYVLLDGFDLGVGMLYGLAPDTASRNIMMNSIAPIWDGNETWLVLGGLGLLAAFPLAFAIIIPAVYFPILVMLLALVFRGVAFEFRFRDAEHKTFWDHAFSYGSGVATFAQGMVLGGFIQGFQVDGPGILRQLVLDFLTPFSVLTGIALLFGYGLLGAGWLILKTEGEFRTPRAGTAAFASSACSSPSASSASGRRLLSPAHRRALVLLAEYRCFWRRCRSRPPLSRSVTWRALDSRAEVTPFVGAIGLFVLSYVGIAISLYPMIVPAPFHAVGGGVLASDAGLSRWSARSCLLPVILMYTGWSYWVFRGKVRADIGYH